MPVVRLPGIEIDLSDGTFTIGLSGLFPRERRPSKRFGTAVRDLPGIANSALPGQVPSGPTSTNPFPAGAQRPTFGNFPSTPAANDSLFEALEKVKRAAKRVPFLNRVVNVAEVLVAVAEGIQLESIEQILRRQDIDLQKIQEAAIERRLRRDRLSAAELAVAKLLNAPRSQDVTPTQPTPAPVPKTAPLQVPLPGIGIPLPLPIPSPRPMTIPSPAPLPVPRPAPRPAARPSIDFPSVPDRFLFPRPTAVPSSVPFSVPSQNPLVVGDPALVAAGAGASSLQPGALQLSDTLQFPQPALAAQSAKCRPRRCEEDEDNPRVECFKGLYREGPTETDFTQWTEIDCITGKEL